MPPRLTWENLAKGLYCFSLGLFKKVLIADTLGGAADYGFALAGQLSSSDAVLTILAYTLQLYFDFSGYCDMAWGIAKMLVSTCPCNFDSPYRAVSVSDFWSRCTSPSPGFSAPASTSRWAATGRAWAAPAATS